MNLMKSWQLKGSFKITAEQIKKYPQTLHGHRKQEMLLFWSEGVTDSADYSMPTLYQTL